MKVSFKYKDKIITTPNLEKKLKQMKITISDIEIIPTPTKKIEESGIDSTFQDKELVYVSSTLDKIKRAVYVLKGTRPPLKDIFLKQGFTPEFISTLTYDS